MSAKKFHTVREHVGNTEIRYIAAEDFVEMGSISGCQFFSAIMFSRLYSSEFSPYLWKPHWEFVEKSIKEFVKESGLDIAQKYPFFKGAHAKMYQLPGWENYNSLLVTIFNDYHKVLVRIEEVSHQTFYIDMERKPFIDSAEKILHGIRKAKRLAKLYPNPDKKGGE